MITYLQGQNKGTVGKHSDNFEFYLDTAVYYDEKIMKWTVMGRVKLKVIKECCVGNPIFILTVNGEDMANGIWLDDRLFEPGEYPLGSFINFYSSSFKETTVQVYTSFILEANEKGPGTCVAETKIVLPSVLNASGIMLADNSGASSVALRVVDLAPTIGYTRILEFYYKRSTDEQYTFLDREIIMKDIESFTRYVTGLVPGVSYDFKCVISTSTGEHLITLKRTLVTALKLPRLDMLYRTTSEIMLKVSELESVVNYERTLQVRYRVKGSLNWIISDVGDITIQANTPAEDYILDFKGLDSGTNYEFELNCMAGDTQIFAKSIFVNTASDVEGEDSFLIIGNGSGVLTITIKNSKLNAGIKTLAVYVQDASKKYHCIGCYDSTYFSTGYTFTVTPDVSIKVKELICGQSPTYKLIFSDQTTNIVEDIRYVVGG